MTSRLTNIASGQTRSNEFRDRSAVTQTRFLAVLAMCSSIRKCANGNRSRSYVRAMRKRESAQMLSGRISRVYRGPSMSRNHRSN